MIDSLKQKIAKGACNDPDGDAVADGNLINDGNLIKLHRYKDRIQFKHDHSLKIALQSVFDDSVNFLKPMSEPEAGIKSYQERFQFKNHHSLKITPQSMFDDSNIFFLKPNSEPKDGITRLQGSKL